MNLGKIEDAILKRINDAMIGAEPVLAWRADVKGFGADVAAGIERATKNFPAVIATYTGSTLVQATRTAVKLRHTWNVMGCARSLRNEKQGRRGGQDSNPGSYQMCGDIAMLLHGFAAVDEEDKQIFDPITVRGIRPVLNDVVGANLLSSIYSVDIEMIGSMTAITDDTEDLFAIFHANWDVPVFGNVSTDLPADDTADATDHVELETE